MIILLSVMIENPDSYPLFGDMIPRTDPHVECEPNS